MVDKKFVVAIPPSYDSEQELELESTVEYMKYLYDNGARTVMTTAGTSQFNFLSFKEIYMLNSTISDSFEGKCILGIPGVSTSEACKYVYYAKGGYSGPDSHLMVLYPDRFYDNKSVIDLPTSLKEANCLRPILTNLNMYKTSLLICAKSFCKGTIPNGHI